MSRLAACAPQNHESAQDLAARFFDAIGFRGLTGFGGGAF
jgi:hypothetical protein